MPRRHSERSKARKRGREVLPKHWLGEGSIGQDSLLVELDPYLYAIDRKLCHRLAQVAFRHVSRGGKPSALLVVGRDSVPWHIGFLSERFRLWIWGEDQDDLLDAAGENFDAAVFYGELPAEAYAVNSVAFFASSAWSSERDFVDALRTLYPAMIEGGEILAVVRFSRNGHDGMIQWTETARETSLSDLTGGRIFGIQPPSMVDRVRLEECGTLFDFGISDFLRRHRYFFGQEARDLCLQRMRDPDFLGFMRGVGSVGREAILLGWGSKSESEEGEL